jgi:geranylgeranyl diphosphate synthase type II
MDATAYVEERIALVNAELDRRLPSAAEPPRRLHEAMRYSVMAGGKRLRPLLCLAAAEAAGASPARALTPAVALEILHTYTLIHDDLPAMDDDALRRGRPTCHVVFGEALAILAGDALLTLAFEWLARESAPTPHPPGRLSLELAEAAGSLGVVGGQVEDLEAEGQPPDADRVRRIHERKTAALLRAAARMGAIAAGAPESVLAALSLFGDRLGLAFQIVDDILNATSDAVTLGKAAGSDQARGKLTYVAVFGLEEARRRADALLAEGLAVLQTLPGPTAGLTALAERIVRRTS